jgi:hypothetical protein
MNGDRTDNITGLVFTKNVAFATVVPLTAKMNAAKCRLSIVPEATTKISACPSNLLSPPVDNAKRITATEAMDSRKKVRDIAEACVAYLMKIALEPKENAATERATIPFDRANPEPFNHLRPYYGVREGSVL